MALRIRTEGRELAGSSRLTPNQIYGRPVVVGYGHDAAALAAVDS